MRRLFLRLYPKAWRSRYGAEMRALLDQTPPRAAATWDLLRGALRAHLWPLSVAPQDRAPDTITRVLGCFIIFCFFGAGFAKTTENYDYAERAHPLLGTSHSIILVGAIVAAGALALAAAPLALASLDAARRTRDPALVKLIAVPPTAIVAFLASIGLLVLWLNAHHHRAGVGGWLLLGLCALCALAGGVACWAAPRAIMRRINVPQGAFAFAVPAVGLLALCMVAITLSTGVFLSGILADAPRLGASGNGPGEIIDVTTSVSIQLAGMLSASALAALGAARGLRSPRAR